ncbi:MAG: glycosyltransferase [Armatimonadetes bacterium]|nr:glycosyltransferase [Armatimonadota bacterium]MDE2205688.1 glycosyltransferase [Armatimonadota bacterium]
MRVLLVTNLFPSEQEPTRGTFTLNALKALCAIDDVQVVSPLPWWDTWKRPSQLFTTPVQLHGGVRSHYPTMWAVPRMPVASAAGCAASIRPLCRRIHRSFPFEVVLGVWAWPDAAAAGAVARDFNVPVVVKVVGSDINRLAQRPDLRPRIGRALNKAAAVIAVSEPLRHALIELEIPGDRITVVPGGVNGQMFAIGDRAVARDRLGLPHGEQILLYVGNYRTEKGVDLLLEAMRLMNTEGECPLLLMVGGGELEAVLRSRAEEWGITGRVRFCGRQLQNDLPTWFAAADAFCLASRSEGCPNVLLEAMSCGRPVVAAAVGGIPNMVTQDTGILVSPEKPDEFAAAIRKALAAEWTPERIRAAGAGRTWEEVGGEIHGVLQRAVAQMRG